MLNLVGIFGNSIGEDEWEAVSDFICENLFDEFVLARIAKLEI